ncbi:alpha/beta hydrolase [Paenarthrobacter sp. PH39-S1]|uniref:alpha/beta hydrolase n=1 Tax=Paenarthrobacter sp. PH39-S1 TaxID=3046204 RepID=UPI0024B92AF7|nr:alpha/beta hydrolase [Paenarthrobacter sp. PH39-S1]MDJ0354678.1 alpha/beta hydrolase [Paenarthrobacter sp. PH39-S1]
MAKNAAKQTRNPAKTDGTTPHQPADISRRLLLLALGGAAAVTAFRSNIAANYLITDNLSFKVITPQNTANSNAAGRFPGATWYLLGGFEVSNSTAGRKLAALQPAMNERAEASYIGYSNRGIDVAQLFIAIIRDAYVRKISTVYLYGDSFGGMVAVVLAPLLEQNGLHVKLIVFGSSPSSVEDVKDPGKKYISLAGAVVPNLGIVGRLGWGVWSGLSNPNGQDMYTAAQSGVQSSFDDGQNSLILNTSQATFLKAFPAQFDGGVSPLTGIGLLYDPTDFIVNAASAMRGWRRLLPNNTFFRYDIASTGHASPEIHPDTYQSALRVLQDVLAPPPSVPPVKTRYF